MRNLDMACSWPCEISRFHALDTEKSRHPTLLTMRDAKSRHSTPMTMRNLNNPCPWLCEICRFHASDHAKSLQSMLLTMRNLDIPCPWPSDSTTCGSYMCLGMAEPWITTPRLLDLPKWWFLLVSHAFALRGAFTRHMIYYIFHGIVTWAAFSPQVHSTRIWCLHSWNANPSRPPRGAARPPLRMETA